MRSWDHCPNDLEAYEIGLIAGLTLLVVWAIRRARVPAATVPHATGHTEPAKEILQAQYALGWRPQYNQTGQAQTSQTPFEILKARYARGEISREEYDQMRRDLEG